MVDMAKAKKPNRSWTPFGELSSFQNIVAKISPVTRIAPRRMPKSSGIRLEFVRERLEMTAISIQHGLANVGTEEERLGSFGAPETSLPLEMLALIASLRESFGLVMELIKLFGSASCLC